MPNPPGTGNSTERIVNAILCRMRALTNTVKTTCAATGPCDGVMLDWCNPETTAVIYGPCSAFSRLMGGRSTSYVYWFLIGPRSNRQEPAKPVKLSLRTRKTERNYVMRKSTPTLTQSGMLAVLLQRQRYKVFQLARRHAHRKHLRAAFWSTLTWSWRALTAPTLVDDSAESIVGARRRQTFLRVAPSGTDVHFEAKRIERVYRCYSSRPQTAR